MTGAIMSATPFQATTRNDSDEREELKEDNIRNYDNNSNRAKRKIISNGDETEDDLAEVAESTPFAYLVLGYGEHQSISRLRRHCSRRRDDSEQDKEQNLGWMREHAGAKHEEFKIMHIAKASEHEDVFIWLGVARILHNHEVVIRVGELGSSSTREDRHDIEKQFGGTDKARCSLRRGAPSATSKEHSHEREHNEQAPYLDSGFPRPEPIVLDIIGSRALAYITHKIEPGIFVAGSVSEKLIELPKAVDEVMDFLFNGSMSALLRVEVNFSYV
ncbi:hypothetical protein FBU30_000793 [Linnemannia zychae]|nr:hypothetical protein FBU30_000793 [Linnemannia zychae]